MVPWSLENIFLCVVVKSHETDHKCIVAPAKSTRQKPGDKQCITRGCTWKVNTRRPKSRANQFVLGRCPTCRNKFDEKQRKEKKKQANKSEQQKTESSSAFSSMHYEKTHAVFSNRHIGQTLAYAHEHKQLVEWDILLMYVDYFGFMSPWNQFATAVDKGEKL
jgi:hypothetical protein